MSTAALMARLQGALRLRPDRILVGEALGRDALDLLAAWKAQHGSTAG